MRNMCLKRHSICTDEIKVDSYMSKHTLITLGILLGLILGMVLGELVFRFVDPASHAVWADTLKFLGEITFMNWLKMILLPLVASSVIVGVASLNPAHLGRVGGWTMVYYFSTMIIAVVLGVALVSAIAPGEDFNEDFRQRQVEKHQSTAEKYQSSIKDEGVSGEQGVLSAVWGSAKRLIRQMIPTNPIQAAAKGEVLPIIVFGVLLGVALSVLGPKGKPLLDFFQAVFNVVMKLVDWILHLAPIGVLFLTAYSVINVGGSEQLLGPLGWYIVTVIAGLLIHGLFVLPLMLWIFGKTNPYRYMHQMREALMTAFGTDSSSATLPVTMECAEKYGGVSKKSAGFVLPLGATVNMDGTALYEAVAVVFLFQCYGVSLTGVELAVIVITATLAAIGAAGIPSAGLVTMVIVVEAVNNSLGAGAATLPLAAVGVILGVDRILDMCRTTVNVWGDAVGAKIITRIAPDH